MTGKRSNLKCGAGNISINYSSPSDLSLRQCVKVVCSYDDVSTVLFVASAGHRSVYRKLLNVHRRLSSLYSSFVMKINNVSIHN
jgi:hypothetical protein